MRVSVGIGVENHGGNVHLGEAPRQQRKIGLRMENVIGLFRALLDKFVKVRIEGRTPRYAVQPDAGAPQGPRIPRIHPR